jgi:hypothetical protein
VGRQQLLHLLQAAMWCWQHWAQLLAGQQQWAAVYLLAWQQ